MPAPPANGAIFQASMGYAPLTSGARAAMVGDLVTIILVENTQAQKTNSASTDRSGNIGITPPTTGPLSFFKETDTRSPRAPSSAARARPSSPTSCRARSPSRSRRSIPNGTYLLRGEKHLTLNRGDETIQITGIVRAVDIDSHNSVPSTRVADARITYTGKGEIARASSQGWLGRFFSRVSPVLRI